jgi:pyridoxal phosphate enzyme (YggS family)
MILTNVVNIKKQIDEVCKKINRDPKEVVLLAAIKDRTPAEIKEIFSAGVNIIGESKVQEMKMKIPLLPKKLRLDFIGHIQTNKVKDVVQTCFLIHSVDSLHLAQEIDRQAKKIGKIQNILLEINVSGEKTKYGFKKEEIINLFPQLLELKNLKIMGLMTIAPYLKESEKSRPFLKDLRLLKKQLEVKFNVTLSELSMGMSNDYKIAIEEGATIIRLGRIIFD